MWWPSELLPGCCLYGLVGIFCRQRNAKGGSDVVSDIYLCACWEHPASRGRLRVSSDVWWSPWTKFVWYSIGRVLCYRAGDGASGSISRIRVTFRVAGSPDNRAHSKFEGAPFKLGLSGAFLSAPARSRSGRFHARCASASGPLRLNLDCSRFAGRVVTKAAPRPVLRFRYESALHRIAMKIAQLLSELAFTPDIEVVVTLLPEWLLGSQGEPTCHPLLQGFQCLCECAALGFIHQQMNMLRHDDVSVNAEPVGSTDPFQRRDKDCAGFRRCELWLPVVAAESEEMILAGLLKALQRPGHEGRLCAGACECL